MSESVLPLPVAQEGRPISRSAGEAPASPTRALRGFAEFLRRNRRLAWSAALLVSCGALMNALLLALSAGWPAGS